MDLIHCACPQVTLDRTGGSPHQDFYHLVSTSLGCVGLCYELTEVPT